jgi:hypothetical protein
MLAVIIGIKLLIVLELRGSQVIGDVMMIDLGMAAVDNICITVP